MRCRQRSIGGIPVSLFGCSWSTLASLVGFGKAGAFSARQRIARKWPTISRVLMPRAYMEIDFAVDPGETALVLGNQLRVKPRLAVTRHRQVDFGQCR